MGILIFICSALFVCLFVTYLNYLLFTRHTKEPKISYKEFKSLFSIAPEKWTYVSEWELRYFMSIEPMRTWKTLYINTMCGFLKAKRDIYRYENKKIDKISENNKSELLTFWKKDIEEYKRKHYNDAKDELDKIKNISSEEIQEIVRKAITAVLDMMNICKTEAEIDAEIRSMFTKKVSASMKEDKNG